MKKKYGVKRESCNKLLIAHKIINPRDKNVYSEKAVGVFRVSRVSSSRSRQARIHETSITKPPPHRQDNHPQKPHKHPRDLAGPSIGEEIIAFLCSSSHLAMSYVRFINFTTTHFYNIFIISKLYA